MAKVYSDENGEYELRPGKYGGLYRHYLNGEEPKGNKKQKKLTDEELKKEENDDEYKLYQRARINPDSIDPMTENSTDWEALDKKYGERFSKDYANSQIKTAEVSLSGAKKTLEMEKENYDRAKRNGASSMDLADRKKNINDLELEVQKEEGFYNRIKKDAESGEYEKKYTKDLSKNPSQDDIDKSYIDTAKKDQERAKSQQELLDQARAKMEQTKETPKRNYNQQSYIEAKSAVDREMRRDGDLSDDEYLKKLVDKYTDIENRSPQDYDMKKILREVKEDALKAREGQRQSEKENALSGIPSPSNDKYKEYYKKENLGEPSNYKAGDKIEYKSGYGEKLTGTVVREATDKEKEFQMNKNLKGYVVKNEFGEHIVPDTRIQVGKTIVEANKAYKDNKPIIDSNKKSTNETINEELRQRAKIRAIAEKTLNEQYNVSDRKGKKALIDNFNKELRQQQELEKKYGKLSNEQYSKIKDEAYKELEDFKNKQSTNDYMNDKIRNNRKKSEDQIAREQLEDYKNTLKDPTKSKVRKADIKKRIFKK